MRKRIPFDGSELAEQGLNMQAVLGLDELPAEIIQQLHSLVPGFSNFRQLILIGHGGRLLWEKLNTLGLPGSDPIDSYSRRVTRAFFAARFAAEDYELLFPLPDQGVIGLQVLGGLAGWHHETPFRVGINDSWGSWFAYRAVVLARSSYRPTSMAVSTSPCLACLEKPCMAACPVRSEHAAKLDILQCIDERRQTETKCRDRCLARIACPVANEHRYSQRQLQYHYLRSWRTIMDM